MAGVNTELIAQIDSIKLSERHRLLRKEYLEYKPFISVKRAMAATQSWKETEGEPIVLRRAKLLRRVAEEIPVAIFPKQLLVCSESEYFRGPNVQVDFDGCFLLPLLKEERLKLTMGGPVEKGMLKKEDWDTLIEIAKFWKGKTVVDKARELGRTVMGSWYDDLSEAGVMRYDYKAQLAGCLMWERVVNGGFRGFIKEAEARRRDWMQNQDHHYDRLYFWEASIIVCEAMIHLAKRYAQHAREMASIEQDPDWRAKLEDIAEICEWVPENPARTFREALQSVVLTDLGTKLETPHYAPTGFGLMDQYLYPFFKRDLEEGRLSIGQAADLIADLLLWCCRRENVSEVSWRDFNQKGNLMNIGLGGSNRKGEEISNELTYLILHVAGLVSYPEPHIAIRWRNDTPRWLMRKAIETNVQAKGGIPQFQNGDLAVQYMLQRGVPLENANGWVTHGCAQGQPDNQGSSMATDYLNVPLCVDLALHNGIASKTGKKIGVETGDPRSFTAFEEFYNAFKKQAQYVFSKQLWFDRLVDQIKAKDHAQPLVSTLMPGCVEKGLDFSNGGLCDYRMTFRKDRGIIPAADSLTAVKKLVYEDGKLKMDELIAALDSNFEGERGEEIRQMCLAVPKYGNDIDEADFMVRDVARFTGGWIQSQKNIWGLPYAVNRNGQAWHFFAGKRLAALPYGRKAGEPLPDGSLSPMGGVDTKGPTALLNSVLKADSKHDSVFGVLNVKLPASILKNRELQDKCIDMIGGFFRSGGTYIQFNIMDAETLRKAKETPQEYRDLVVRVGGYSAYFVTLSPEVQDEIIRRTEHSL